MNRRETIWTIAIVGVSLLWLGALMQWTPLTPVNDGRDIDGVYYTSMARDPWSVFRPLPQELDENQLRELALDPARWGTDARNHFAPFCYRILSPALVSLFAKARPVAGFLMLSFVGQWIAAALLWLLLRRLGVSPWLAALGVALHLTSFWGPRFAFWSPCHPETTSLIITLALLLSITSHVHWLTAVLLAVGALQREQILTLALFQALWLWREGRRPLKAFALAALLVLPGFLMLLALRIAIEPINSFNLLDTIRFYSAQRWDHIVESHGIYIVRFLVGVLHTLGALPFLILLGGKTLWRDLKREWPWWGMVAVTLVLVWTGGVDCERRAYYALPLILAPLLANWQITRRTAALMIWALVCHIVLNLALIDLSSNETYTQTAISVFMTSDEVPRHLARLGSVWVALLVGGLLINRV